MTHVLDTNIVIGALNGIPAVTEHLVSLSESDVGIPLIVIAELLYGAIAAQGVARATHTCRRG